MHRSRFWWIIVVFLILIDVYFFQAIEVVSYSASHTTRTIILVVYWVIASAALLLLLLLPYLHFEKQAKLGKAKVFALVAGIFFGQIVGSLFFLIDDIRRGIEWLSGMRGISRSLVLSWLGIGTGSALFFVLLYGFTNKYRYQVRKVKLHFPNLPPAFKGFKLVHISDIHSGSFNNKEAVQRGVDKILRQDPDLILFTGDLVNNVAEEMKGFMRYQAKQLVMNGKLKPTVTADDVEKMLGKPKYSNDIYKTVNMPGVSVGLAWTYAGGDILFIETSLSDGKGELRLTGNLGNVMKESASTALTYLQSNANKYKLDTKLFEKKNIHVHVPEGAVPKDGPSAGITMMVSIASALTGKRVKPFMGMTGEITLRGQVLPVGGIKEKVLAAKRAGLKEIILCWQNQKDVEEIEPDFIKGINFHFVKNMSNVLELALVNGQ